jgi:hypothetical protein
MNLRRSGFNILSVTDFGVNGEKKGAALRQPLGGPEMFTHKNRGPPHREDTCLPGSFFGLTQ